MNKLLESFLELAKGNEDGLSVETLLSDDEKFEWETLVKALDSIDIMNVGRDLKKIQKTYQLNRWQEISILAYVKILEMMVRRAKEAGALDMLDKNIKPPTSTKTDYTGSMFG